MDAIPTLLPINATRTERDIEQATGRADLLPAPLRELWNPDTCPAALLPWLAWSLSVDVWKSDWPESTKRAVVSASMDVHRRKGTVRAVRDAVGALDTALSVREWWQYGGEPYTARLEARLAGLAEDGSGVTPEALTDLLNVVDATAPVRVHFELLVGLQFTRPQGAAAIVQQPDTWLGLHMRQAPADIAISGSLQQAPAAALAVLAPVSIHLREAA
jgi:phage tail P2-like protein